MQGCKQRRLELIVVVIAGLALSVAPVHDGQKWEWHPRKHHNANESS